MKRWMLGLVLLSCFAQTCLSDARAFERRDPPRRKRGSYAEYIIIRQKDSPPRVRQVYTGYSAFFPPPAFLYYGYPHSGDDSGIGPLGRN
jgi:hypothetical protein